MRLLKAFGRRALKFVPGKNPSQNEPCGENPSGKKPLLDQINGLSIAIHEVSSNN